MRSRSISSGEIRLDKSRAGVNVDLTQRRVARVNESMGGVGWNDDDAARFHLALFISDRDAGAAFEGECDLHVRMLVQRRALPRLRADDVGREGRTLIFADELMRHSNKWQLLETDKAHVGKLRESFRRSRVNFEMPSEFDSAIFETAIFIHRKRLMMRNSSG